MGFWSRKSNKRIEETAVTNKEKYNWKLTETWEDYPVPNYKIKHTYFRSLSIVAVKLFITEQEIPN